MADEMITTKGPLARLQTAQEVAKAVRNYKLHVLLIQEQDDVSAGVAAVRAYQEGAAGLAVRRGK